MRIVNLQIVVGIALGKFYCPGINVPLLRISGYIAKKIAATSKLMLSSKSAWEI